MRPLGWILVLAGCLALHGAPVRGATPEPVTLRDGRTFLHDLLDNGLEVSVVADPGLELVATQVWYHVGSADEDEGSRGLAHLFEHLMFGPTEQYEKDAVFRLHHRHGGYNNASTSFDRTAYVSTVAPPHHLEVMSMEAARMRGLQLTQENLDNEQRIVTEELRARTENDPLDRVLVSALKAILGDHPYAHTPVGTKEDIAATTVDSCRRFYERHYDPANAHIVVVGPVDPEKTLEAARERFGALETRGIRRHEIPLVMDWTFPAETVLTEDLPPVETATAFFPLPAQSHPDAVPLALLQTMIDGAASPFREDLVRGRGKALEAGVLVFWNRRGGALGFYSAHLPYRRKKTAFRQIERSLQAVAASLTGERLDAARREHLLRLSLERYWASSQADSLGRARWNLGETEEAFHREERVREVTLDDIQRVWRSYVEEPEPVWLHVKPEHVPVLVRLFGWLYPLVN